MPSLSDLKRQGYRSQRAVSHGAGITLVAGCGHYIALFDCARHCAEALGDNGLEDAGDGILEVIPRYKIRNEDLYEALIKLSARYSVALVEFSDTEKMGGRFVCLWRINSTPVSAVTPSINLDDY